MAIPKRQYVVARKRGSKTRYFWGNRLKDALGLAGLRLGEKFSYRIFEGSNSVECAVTRVKPLHYSERGK